MEFSKTISEKITMKDSIEMKIKRGERSQSYLWLAYTILLTITIATISVLPIDTLYKIIAIILSVFFLFRLCLHNSWFRNKIVGIFNKVAEKEEKF
ncbi:MAG TPA: hypothetical protein ENI76_09760 [Ignavibacteria bacterium]|nr:hypothetical protein [Ignavibacteria bacterium]